MSHLIIAEKEELQRFCLKYNIFLADRELLFKCPNCGKISKGDGCDCGYNPKPEDLKEFGMMPELLGRFPIITPLQELSEEALIEILTEPKNAIMKQMIKSFNMDNITLSFEKGALSKIAKKAKARKTGARALRSIVEEVIEDAKYICPGSNINTVIIKDDLSLEYKEN